MSQSSIKFISSLLDKPHTLTDADHNAVSQIRQAFPYFVPARYIQALEKHKKSAWSPAMLSEIQPYSGNWMLFANFLEAGMNSATVRILSAQPIEVRVTDKKSVEVTDKKPEVTAAPAAKPAQEVKAPSFAADVASNQPKPAPKVPPPPPVQPLPVRTEPAKPVAPEVKGTPAVLPPPVKKEEPKPQVNLNPTMPASPFRKEEPKPVPPPVIEVKKEEPKPVPPPVIEVKKEEPKPVPPPVIEVKKEEPKPAPPPVIEVKKEEPKPVPPPVIEVKKEEPKPVPPPVIEVKKEEPKPVPPPVIEVKKEEPKPVPPPVIEVKKEEPKPVPPPVIEVKKEEPKPVPPPVIEVKKEEPKPVPPPVIEVKKEEPKPVPPPVIEVKKEEPKPVITEVKVTPPPVISEVKPEEKPAIAAITPTKVEARKEQPAELQPAVSAQKHTLSTKLIPVKVVIEEEKKEIPKPEAPKPAPIAMPHPPVADILEPATDKEPLIYPVYTEDYFLQQGVKVSEEIPEDVEEFKEATEADEDMSLMVMMSFSEWLLHFKNTSDKQREEKNDQKALKTMWQKEKLAAALEEENEEIPENVFEMAVNSITKEEGLASEALAEIHVKQGKYDKAIEMYRKLSLRNPKKNAYFARRIEEILKEKQS